MRRLIAIVTGLIAGPIIGAILFFSLFYIVQPSERDRSIMYILLIPPLALIGGAIGGSVIGVTAYGKLLAYWPKPPHSK
jgi:hypothetical protein